MKNEEKFKVKIAEIAARIAEGSYGDDEKDMEPKEEEMEEAKAKATKPAVNPNMPTPVDVTKFTDKLDSYNQALTPFYNAINSAQELALAVEYMIEKMPNLKGNAVSGLRLAINNIAEKKAAENEKDAVGTADLPALQEAFNRINRK